MINENLRDQNLFENNVATNVWIEVILPLAIPKTYTYSVTSDLQKKSKNRLPGRSGFRKK